MTDDTIVAIASAPGCAVRGIVRCSGPDAVSLADAVFRVETGPRLEESGGFRRWLGDVFPEPDCGFPAEVYVFRAPRSYTRQDCVEFHVPGSPALLLMLVQRLIASGARPAEPGEFTARAFLSGALDLGQAEAVAAVIRARSDTQLRAARRLADGSLSGRIDPAMERLAELVALVEADIDFAEEPIEFITPDDLRDRLAQLSSELRLLVSMSDTSQRFDMLPHVLLIGRSNAGKSTLMNRLSGIERSICSPIAGTTRDLLTAPAALERGECLLIDAAGVEPVTEALLTDARNAALNAAESVDLICHVVDISCDEFNADQEATLFASEAPRLVAANKTDLVSAQVAAEHIDRLVRCGLSAVCPVSARTGDGIDGLRREFSEALQIHHSPASAGMVLLTARQQGALNDALQAIDRCANHAATVGETIDGADVIAFELREALEALGSVCGSVTSDELLGRVFASFCIGK